MGFHLNKDSNKYFVLLNLFLFLFLILTTIVSVAFGSVSLDFKYVYKIITNNIFGREIFVKNWPNYIENIVWNLRVPRIFMAGITGASLSICGIMMQALTKNSLANPYILGISSGASCGAVLTIVLGISFLGIHSISLGAFLGAVLSSLLVFFMANQNKSLTPSKLVLIGVCISALFSSITNLIIFTAKDYNKVRDALFWMIGSLNGSSFDKLLLPFFVFVFSFSCLIIFSKELNILLMGEKVAITMGVNTKLIKRILIFLTTLLTGVIVSIVGVIGFIGLIIPHSARALVSSNHKKLVITASLLGANIVIISDLISRTIAMPQEVPIGVITAFLGAPFFMFLIKKNSYNFGGQD